MKGKVILTLPRSVEMNTRCKFLFNCCGKSLPQGKKQALILQAQGEAEGIIARAEATALGVKAIAEASQRVGGGNAMALRVAEQYVDAFKELAKQNNTILMPGKLFFLSIILLCIFVSFSFFK